MKTVNISVALDKSSPTKILLGRQGENKATKIIFDCNVYAKSFGAGTAYLFHQRAPDTCPYPVAIEQDGNTIMWEVSASDTQFAGQGQCELFWYVDDVIAKTQVWGTTVTEALTGTESEEVPEAAQGWVSKVLQAIADIGKVNDEVVKAAVEEYLANNGLSDIGGIGFTSWSYDKHTGYIHLYNENGEDAIEPLYVPGLGFEDLTDEEINQVNTILTRASKYAAQAGQSKEAASASAEKAAASEQRVAISAESAAQSASDAATSEANASQSASSAAADAILAEQHSNSALKSAGEAAQSLSDAQDAAETAQEAAQEAVAARDGFKLDATLSQSGQAADAGVTGRELAKRFKSVITSEKPDAPEADTIYYVLGESGIYLAWMFWNGGWKQIGSDNTDLSNYYTKDEIDELLKTISVDLSDYYTKQQIDELLKNVSPDVDLSDYYTKKQVDELFKTVPDTETVDEHSAAIEEINEQLAAVGVSIQSITDDDGTVRQYLVNAEGEPLGDAIVGTGSGGGGGTTATSMISVTLGKNPSSVEYSKSCLFSFDWTSTYPDGGSTGNGSIEFSVKSGTTTTVCATKTMAQGTVTFDFGPFLRAGSNTVIIKITDSEGNTTSRRATVTAQVLGLEIDYNWTTVNAAEASIRWRVSGSSGVTLHATLANAPVATVQNPTVGRWQTLTVDHQAHGTYRLRLWTTLDMDDGTTITSSITGFDLLFTDEGMEKVLIVSDFNAEEPVQQYTAQTIHYFVYDPTAEAVDVTRLVDGDVYASDTAVERIMQEWKWKPNESGRHTVGIQAGTGENQTTRNFVVTVKGVAIPDSVKEVAKYAMKFNPSGHQNSDANPLAGICKDSDGNNITCTVNEGFDWTNGGIQYDALGNAYFCVMSGDRLTIDYKPFATDCKPTGRHIKVCFNTTEVANRSTPWLSCVDAADNGNAVGLVMTPTSATVTSEQNQTLSTRYMYDRNKYFELPEIEMDINIQKASQERLIQYWMEGCPAQVVQYTADDGFAQNEASELVIGSDECEVHLYLMKIADNSWEDEEITDDWIMNAPSGEEMVNRYQRNNIYAMDGSLNFDALPEKLIKVVIHADQWTTGKSSSNYIYGTVDIYIDGRHGTAACRFKGQGTSSMGYIGGGLNIDIDLLSEVTWDDGTTSVGIALTENSIPVTYLNYKVNIASSESYKNMLYAHDYQLFQPYTRPARQANPNVRDTMEFRMAVLCFHNTAEENVWAGNTEYVAGATALYAVGNLGNSKKNLEALGEGVTEEYIDTECLVECTENTTVYQLMHVPVPDDDSIAFPDENTAFEFRYPDGDGTELMKSNFRRMQRWVASTCTEPEYITGEELDEIYVVPNGAVTYRIGANGQAVTVYDNQSRVRKVVENCPYDTETIEVDGEYYTVLPLDSHGKEVTGYSRDTEAYRLGKFLQEFDDYFIFNSIAYHYHVTHQFMMIDNRAKNTFYGTEDGQHWHLVFAYDGDTQMGNNNSGDLTLDYGLEDTDKLGGGYVFNGARHTLWVNIRKLYDKNSPYYNAAFYNRMQSVYQAAETDGAWNPLRRLALMKQWVSLVPEVLWRDDARKKYMNPLLNGDDASYLAKCNGNCLDQAAQFITENQPYFASMWQTSANRENLVTMRGYTPAEYPAGYDPSSAITLTAFSKCYLTVDYDGDIRKPVRLMPGECATFTQGDVKLNDTPVYIPGAQLISAMSPVSRLYPGFCNFNYLSNCQRIEVGEGGSYSNPNLTSLAVGGCKKLRYLDARNTPNLTGTIDVSNSRELRTVLAQGSGASSVTFADGGRLETYHGGSNVTSLVAKNLKSVEVFDLEKYDSVSRIRFEDSPSIDSYDITQRSQNAARIRLTGIVWNLNTTELLNRLYNLRGLDAGGNDTDRAVLTGTCYVARAKESEIARYTAAWPMLEITCGEVIKEYTVSYCDEDGETVLYQEIYEEGAAWSDPVVKGAMKTPTKAEEERVAYTFSGWNQMPTTITEDITLIAVYKATAIVIATYYQNDGVTLIGTKRFASGSRYVDPVESGEWEAPTLEPSVEYTYTFAGWDSTPTTITEDISIFATYTRTSRRYTVKWHNYGGATIQQVTAVAHSSVSYSGELNLTRPSTGDVVYLWLGEWDQDTSDIISDMDIYPVFLECVLPISAAYVPEGWFIYSDNPDDNMVYTREEFAAIMMSDEIEKYISIGDRIKMCINSPAIVDRQLTFSLHAYHHYRLSGSEEFSNSAWYMTGLLSATRVMNSTSTNVGGWPATALRNWMNNTLYPTLPIFWRCLMKKVQILSSVGNISADIVSSEDYLFVPSYAEMGFGVNEQPYHYEVDTDADEIRFAMYTGNDQRIKKLSNGDGSASYYWTRSPYSGSSSSFCYIGNNGNGDYTGASGSYGVCVGLSI